MTKWYYRIIDENGNIKSASIELPNTKASEVAQILEDIYGDVLTLTRVEEIRERVKNPIKPLINNHFNWLIPYILTNYHLGGRFYA